MKIVATRGKINNSYDNNKKENKNNNNHLQKWVEGIKGYGGEGVVLRKLGSFYFRGRSPSLLKLKAAMGDQEGIVIGRENDSVVICLPDKTTFTIPAHNVQVPKLQIGDIVSFSFKEKNNKNESPVIYRVRSDLLWEDVVFNFEREKNNSVKVSSAEMKELRKFMENFAVTQKKDPLIPATWYSIAGKAFRQFKLSTHLRDIKFNLGLLKRIFPELKFDSREFTRSPWDNIENRRKFFEKYAKENGFDSQDPHAWYIQPREKIMSYEGATNVVMRHGKNIRQTLVDLFPNIGLDKPQFWDTVRAGVVEWHKPSKRREFFESYAQQQYFDPLVPENWYSRYTEISLIKGASLVLQYHKKSASKALIDLFPDVSFDTSKLLDLPTRMGTWSDVENRKLFFINYAKENNFDALVAKNWYKQSRQKILSNKGGGTVLSYHEDNLTKALFDLFPNIGLDISQFPPKWSDPNERRQFFVNYAKEKGFNPFQPDNWYSQQISSIVAVKGASGVLYYHQRSVVNALVLLFPELDFDTTKFNHYMRRDITTMRQLFIEYAEKNRFDPLVATNWYHQPRDRILIEKDAKKILRKYDNSISKALVELFPEVEFNIAKF